MNIDLINKDVEIRRMKRDQESQELELRKAARMKEVTERFIGKLDIWKRLEWSTESLTLAWDCEVEQRKGINTNIMESPQ